MTEILGKKERRTFEDWVKELQEDKEELNELWSEGFITNDGNVPDFILFKVKANTLVKAIVEWSDNCEDFRGDLLNYKDGEYYYWGCKLWLVTKEPTKESIQSQINHIDSKLVELQKEKKRLMIILNNIGI